MVEKIQPRAPLSLERTSSEAGVLKKLRLAGLA